MDSYKSNRREEALRTAEREYQQKKRTAKQRFKGSTAKETEIEDENLNDVETFDIADYGYARVRLAH